MVQSEWTGRPSAVSDTHESRELPFGDWVQRLETNGLRREQAISKVFSDIEFGRATLTDRFTVIMVTAK